MPNIAFIHLSELTTELFFLLSNFSASYNELKLVMVIKIHAFLLKLIH